MEKKEETVTSGELAGEKGRGREEVREAEASPNGDAEHGSILSHARVDRVEPLSRSLFRLVLRSPRPLAARPGQFCLLRPAGFDLHPLLGRPMSVLEDGQHPAFLVRRVGSGTRILTSLGAGAAVDMIGPLGVGWGEPPPVSAGRLVLVAGGVGLAPLLFAARAARQSGLRPLLLYGAKEAEEIVMRQEIEALTEAVITTEDGSLGRKGLVTSALAELLSATSVGQVWTCGPEAMMAVVAKLAREHGVSCKVSVEGRMACGRGLCMGCARQTPSGRWRLVCAEGPVFDGAELFGPAVGPPAERSVPEVGQPGRS